MSMQQSDFTENLFRSIDTIIAERIKHLPYDKTQIVEIIEDKHAGAGIYTVTSDNQFKELAYSDNPTYKVGDKVYLMRVAGSEKRIIIGLFLTSDGKRINRIYE